MQIELTWITVLMENLLCAGAVYGWANINPVLVQEGYFSHNCTTGNQSLVETPCKQQAEKLNLVFTIATVAGQASTVLTGTLLDKLGGWITRTFLLILTGIGYLILGVSDPSSSFLLYFAFSMMNIAGVGLMLTNSQLANLYSKYRVSFSTSGQGAFNSGSTVFLIMNTLYYTGVKFKHMVYFYIAFSFSFHIRTFLLTPRYSIPHTLPHEYSYGYRELSCSATKTTPTTNEEDERADFTTKDDLKQDHYDPDDKTFKDCLREIYSWTLLLCFCLIQFISTFFIATLDVFLPFRLGADEINILHYTRVFGMLQCCCIVFSPLNGLLVDYLRQRFLKTLRPQLASFKALAFGFTVGNMFTIGMLICSLIPNAHAQYVTLVFQVIGRTTYFGCVNFFLSYVYPTKHFGKIFGLTVFVAGSSLVLVYPLTLLVVRVFGSDFTVVNLVFLTIACCCLVHPGYLLYYVHKTTKSEKLGTHDSVDETELCVK